MKKQVGENQYLEALSEFIAFLSGDVLTLDQILSHMVLVVFAPLDAEAIVMFQINGGNQVERVGAWGIPLEMFRPNGNLFNLSDKYPSTDTLRYRRTTWINTLPEWGDDYPLFKEFPYTTGAKSFICFPIEKASTPVAALGVFSRNDILPNAEIESFLKAVGCVLSMSLYHHESSLDELQKGHRENIHSDSKIKELTERQMVILRLISEDRTNLVVSDLLGYSESTIRQETIKIFSILECNGRYAAGQIYREEMDKSKDG